MNDFKMKFQNLFQWEYWQMELVYYPLIFFWLYFAAKAKSLFFFNAANPGIQYGGLTMESKKKVYDLIPSQYYPKTLFFYRNTSISTVLREIEQAKIQYPFIMKPDIGMKGFGVEKIENQNDLEAYTQKIFLDYLVQELITFPEEVGIFYYRKPGENKGAISGIVGKEFLSITGNGKSSLIELIKLNPRSFRQVKSLEKEHGKAWLQQVLPEGEIKILVPYGSHTRGSKFIDITHQKSEGLESVINEICIQVKGFYYGRLDIRFENMESLSQGKNFSIIELNGAGSEPTHIYDPKHTIFQAWKEIVKHWSIMCDISKLNHANGTPYLSIKDGFALLKESAKVEAQLKSLH